MYPLDQDNAIDVKNCLSSDFRKLTLLTKKKFMVITFDFFRIFSHPNVLPVVGCSNHPPNLVVITQYLPNGSLFTLLHQDSGIVVDTAQALKFALDIARGMAFIHSLEKLVPNLYLSSKHVMVSMFSFSPNLSWFVLS